MEDNPANVEDNPTAAARTGSLTDLRVIELGTLIAGPFAGRILADAGATVIKVESRKSGGDQLRTWGTQSRDGKSVWWFAQSRNKLLVTLDLHTDEGRDLLLRLAAEADVVLENFRPGTLERWGIGPDRLLQVNPRLVIARVSGYGQSGPYSRRPGFAAGAEALSSLRYVNGYPDQAPPRTGVAIGDTVTALYAVIGILMALRVRDRTGQGQVVDAAILDSCISLLDGIIPEYGSFGAIRQPAGTTNVGSAPSNIFRTRDGHWLVVAANADRLFRSLCVAIGRPDLLEDPRFERNDGRTRHREELEAIIAGWVAVRDRDRVLEILTEAGVVTVPVNDVRQMVGDPHVQAERLVITVPTREVGEVLMPAVVPRLSRTPGAVSWPARWELGADNQEVFGDLLGLDAETLEDLRKRGVL